ncbi:spermidine synthase [Enhygromyxa salina]|uniref:Spermidine synthase n=1 Tax=Enhygromyxa salina TaxID=215803 RepID=A0A2S9YGW1_9BACT|nr:MnmC family methyltransferase [Enhygromyxa salina]PRQ04281.1 spermidine synthase [Enhygromyxa salina]
MAATIKGYTAAMRPWETLAEADAPDGQRVALRRRGHEFLIRVGGWDLMSSRDDTSARALATVGCGALRERAGLRVLIGGLGMGYSLAAACELLPDDATIEVAELVPALVEWNRGPLAELAGRPLDDARVRVYLGDVAKRIEQARDHFDAILLDVDNGPDPLAHDHNARLYGRAGLRAAHRALRSGGVHAVWSYSDAGDFARVLERNGFDASVHAVPNRGRDRGRSHAIWLGRRRSASRR